MAGVFLDSAAGDLYVFGDSGNDTGSIEQVNAATVRVNLAGVPSRSFATQDFSRIVFLGFAGDDTFTNNSSSRALILGNDGNDRLIGGSGVDEINGGRGNDTIDGRGGNDRIIASSGNDTIKGGTGNDRIFGTTGRNRLDGNDGDDVIYGGDEADTINGGNGADRIFGLAGNDIIDAGNGGTPGSQEDLERDLVLGLDGDDIIKGGSGLNHFYGGNGDDVMIGGNGENVMFGQDGDDRLTGGTGFDYLAGNRGNDTINAGGGNRDLVVYGGNQSGFTVIGSLDRLTVTSESGSEGIDVVTHAENFMFAARPNAKPVYVAARPTARLTLKVQPIVVADDDGSNQATFFGTADQEQAIKDQIDRLYANADVDVQWLTTKTWNNTKANRGESPRRPVSDLEKVVDAGAAAGRGKKGDLVLDVYFVKVSAGDSAPGQFETKGRAFLGADGATLAIGSGLLTFEEGRNAVARLAAHEIGHNLGLDHVEMVPNLMVPSGNTTGLRAAQIETIKKSRFTVARPV